MSRRVVKLRQLSQPLAAPSGVGTVAPAMQGLQTQQACVPSFPTAAQPCAPLDMHAQVSTPTPQLMGSAPVAQQGCSHIAQNMMTAQMPNNQDAELFRQFSMFRAFMVQSGSQIPGRAVQVQCVDEQAQHATARHGMRAGS